MRSDLIKIGTPHRSLLNKTGVIKSDEDFKKLFIGTYNCYIDLIFGSTNRRLMCAVIILHLKKRLNSAPNIKTKIEGYSKAFLSLPAPQL